MRDPVKNKHELLKRLHEQKQAIMSLGVRKLGIFGSFARDEAVAESDVDFFIEFIPGEKTFENFMRLADLLEEITGRGAEIVTAESLNKFTGKYILDNVENVPFAA